MEFQFAGFIEEQEEAAFGSRDGEGGVDDSIEHVFNGETALEGAADFEDGAKFFEIGTGAAGFAQFPGVEPGFGHQAVEFGFGAAKKNLIAIGNAEFDAVLAA